ncbi:50S ribosomal subunit protein L6 [Gammaproteobacteria bacterium]
MSFLLMVDSMSRIAKKPVALPAGVQIGIDSKRVRVKGPKGEIQLDLFPQVQIIQQGNMLHIIPLTTDADQHAGTTRALLFNMVKGVTIGFQRKLELVGVGYRAQAQGAKLNLTLGYSHPLIFNVPEGIKIETPSSTEILINGVSRQLVGQVAANIRSYRPPEPYKGKGVKYSDEVIVRKEAKKK